MDELASLITDRTRLIILNSPHNPTGGVLSKRDIHDIAAAIGDRNIMVLSDEIYSRLVFDGEHHSIMSVPGFQERTILLDGFSKTYAMTGWRMGYGVMRPDLASSHHTAHDEFKFLHGKLYADRRELRRSAATSPRSTGCGRSSSSGGTLSWLD